ncbi:hypothetical protein SCHPADRAFT_897529 [Schizopora paradoxa]|uniref:Uncharacterized protein n=1 Tax=Schizopora paradoxa TaxID=27342 RepID=A0A0H2QXW3_9AGAM|nr:hypothetical protein SCHPADRAFT_897529 [Schizopora paradoxa]
MHSHGGFCVGQMHMSKSNGLSSRAGKWSGMVGRERKAKIKGFLLRVVHVNSGYKMADGQRPNHNHTLRGRAENPHGVGGVLQASAREKKKIKEIPNNPPYDAQWEIAASHQLQARPEVMVNRSARRSFKHSKASPKYSNLSLKWLCRERDLLGEMASDPVGKHPGFVAELGLGWGRVDRRCRAKQDSGQVVKPVVVDVQAERGIHCGRMSWGRF